VTRRTAAFSAVLLSATFVQFLDVSIVNVAAPAIRQDLGASAGATELVASGYTLAFACILITAGRLGDRYGYRRLYAFGMALFTLSSVLCALSPDIAWLISARVAQGLGAGLMAPQVLSIIQVAVAAERRGRVFGAYGSAIGLATVTGPVLGGLLIQLHVPGLDWRLVFAINLPIGVAALCGLRLLPSARRGDPAALDLIGVALAVVGLALLVYPLAVGRQQSWPSWAIVMLCAAPVVLAILVVHQLRRERSGRSPLLKLSLLRDPRLRIGLLVVAAFFAGVPSFFFLLSVYLQAGFGHSALVAGLTQLPFAAATGIGSRWSNRIAARLGRRVLVTATALLAASMLALAAIVSATGTAAAPWEFAAPMVVGGLCFGVFTATAFTQLLSDVPRDAVGSASGMLTTVQQAAGSVGLTLGALVFYATMPSSFPAQDPTTIRAAYATGFSQTLIYELVVFALACAGSALLLRKRVRETRSATRAVEEAMPT
jgi:EmrB/QacA subfamily drug resistance transporter